MALGRRVGALRGRARTLEGTLATSGGISRLRIDGPSLFSQGRIGLPIRSFRTLGTETGTARTVRDAVTARRGRFSSVFSTIISDSQGLSRRGMGARQLRGRGDRLGRRGRRLQGRGGALEDGLGLLIRFTGARLSGFGR